MSIDLKSIATKATDLGVFAGVSLNGNDLECAALEAAAPATYSLTVDGGRVTVRLRTADRWLSESIEGDMLEGRDSAEELVDDELVEVGFPHRCGKVKHYRDDAKVYVFRSEIPLDGIADTGAGIATYLLAFEAAFSQLGDMQGSSAE